MNCAAGILAEVASWGREFWEDHFERKVAHTLGWHSAGECRAHWLNHCSPKVNNGAWSAAEEVKLKELAKRYQERSVSTASFCLSLASSSRGPVRFFPEWLSRSVLGHTHTCRLIQNGIVGALHVLSGCLHSGNQGSVLACTAGVRQEGNTLRTDRLLTFPDSFRLQHECLATCCRIGGRVAQAGLLSEAT